MLHVLAQSGGEFIVSASTTSHHIRREQAGRTMVERVVFT